MPDETKLSLEEALELVDDSELSKMAFSQPWQYDRVESGKDADGFTIKPGKKYTIEELQRLCWDKFNENPQVNSAIRDLVGRLTGKGFSVVSDLFKVQRAIDEISIDPRNRLPIYLSKYVGRALVEGELYLILTVHEDGFVEIDFMDPSNLKGENCIIYHPNKPNMPLFYHFSYKDDTGKSVEIQVPSVYIARYKSLIKEARKTKHYQRELADKNRNRSRGYKKLNGYYRFCVAWDMGLMTARNASHLRTTLQWIEYYENLKKYEIDHKKACGAYAWVYQFEDWPSFKRWLALTDDEKRKTGLAQPVLPGAKLVLPPGVKLTAQNPNLQKISEQDTDIMGMVTSGLNRAETSITGQYKQSLAGAKTSAGPDSDRVSDEQAQLERFLVYEFWSSIFFLMSRMGRMEEYFEVREAVDFDKNQEPIFENVKRKPEELVEIVFPISNTQDLESTTKALMGVKHGSLHHTAGVPNAFILQRLGFGGYKRLRLLHATEEDHYPELAPPVDQESEQEIEEGETPKGGKKKEPKKGQK